MAKDDEGVINLGDASLSKEEAINRAIQVSVAKFSQNNHPNLDSVKTVVLQEGRYVLKVVRCWDIRSQRTGEYKFSTLVFATLRKTKVRGWEFETHRSITLGDKNNPDVIEKLIRFLSSVKSLDTSGDFIISDPTGIDRTRLSRGFKDVSATGQQSVLLSELFEWINEDPQALERLTQLSSDDLHRSQSLVAAINYGRYHRALARFQEIVDENLPERAYQKFLEENHWLFGSEYSELLDKRTLVVGQQLDFPLRRTVDGYLDVIEIKTPLNGESGFIWNSSHKNFFPGSDIHKHTSQILHYLSALQADRHRIMAEDKIDVTRIRGKLIVGRDGSEAEEEARRLWNANSPEIDVLSFDGLIRIGQRIIDIMVEENPGLRAIQPLADELIVSTVDDIPF